MPQSVVCMPSRSTMLTGQHPSTHGVWMNGVALPVDAPSVAAVLHRAGYRTALVGKPHFEPFLDPFGRFAENGLAARRRPHRRLARGPTAPSGPHRGFDHLEFATHGPMGPLHYARWLAAHHPEAVGGFYAVLDRELEVNAEGGGATGAPQVKDNPIPRDWYHTDWVADRTIAWLDGLDADDDWFCWMSFPDPHHPWDPPASELGRVDWRDVPLPDGYVEDRHERERILDAKPRHWRLWYDGALVSNYEAPTRWVPATLTADQVREVNARNAVEVELIDEALGRVLAAVAARGWADDLDVVFTTDHGELQGDFGLLFKGPYHVDGLMRLPLIWRPAPSAGVAPAVVTRPGRARRPGADVLLRPRACPPSRGWRAPPCPSTTPTPTPARLGPGRSPSGTASCWASTSTCARSPATAGCAPPTRPGTVHDGSEGELYDLADDPLQQVNRWDDPGVAARAGRPGRRPAVHARPPPASPRLPLEAPV